MHDVDTSSDSRQFNNNIHNQRFVVGHVMIFTTGSFAVIWVEIYIYFLLAYMIPAVAR